MSNTTRVSRRDFIHTAFRLPVLMGGAASILAACGGGEGEKAAPALACTDVTGLAPADAQLRTAQAYADKSPHADKNCLTCNFYDAGPAGACGGCKVIKGPINPVGYCNLFAKKA
jgi:hypothetical protein